MDIEVNRHEWNIQIHLKSLREVQLIYRALRRESEFLCEKAAQNHISSLTIDNPIGIEAYGKFAKRQVCEAVELNSAAKALVKAFHVDEYSDREIP